MIIALVEKYDCELEANKLFFVFESSRYLNLRGIYSLCSILHKLCSIKQNDCSLLNTQKKKNQFPYVYQYIKNWHKVCFIASIDQVVRSRVNAMTKQQTARLAGFIYLVIVITGIFNLRYVPSQIIDWKDAAVTVANIIEFDCLFRAGIAAAVISYICYLILPLVLFDLFKDVNKRMAVMMVALSVLSVPMALLSIGAKLDVLTLLSGEHYLDSFNAEQLQAQVMLSLEKYNNGMRITQIFWGLWLFPFGYLMFKSDYAPKVLGILLMVGCAGYMVLFFRNILFPDFELLSFITKPASLGEIGSCLWLLIMGVKDKSQREQNV